MALVLAVASGTAMAEEAQLDQEWATHDTAREINQYGGYQSATVGMTATVSKVAVLIGCCGGTDAPAGDLRVTVSSHGVSSTATIPKDTFTNDDVLRWVDIPLDTPIPVVSGSNPSRVLIFLKNTSSTSPYLWAVDTRSSGGTAGGYANGGFTECKPEFRDNIVCDPTRFDANFRTYVIPGPDLVPPDTYLPFAEGGVTNGPPEGSTSSSSRVSFVFYAYENGFPAGSGTTFECQMDNGSWEVCTSPKEYTGLSDSSHIFQVRARDSFGNVDPTPEHRQWFVDDTSPVVSSVSPADQATGVALRTNLEATFSEAMYPGGISGVNFTLTKQDSTMSVPASVSYNSTTKKATLDPFFDLEANQTYTATIKGRFSGVRDLAGNPLEQDYSWTFTTANVVPPETTITSGPSGTVNSTAARFEFASSAPDSTFKCKVSGGGWGAGIWTTCQVPWNIGPSPEATYTFEVYAIDPAGIPDPTPASQTWTVDTAAPAVSSVSPADRATGVALTANLEAAFSEAMDPGSITDQTFTLTEDGSPNPIAANVVYNSANKKATLDPELDLEANASYTATLDSESSGVKDAAGNPLAADKVWTFTTVDTIAPSAPLISSPAEGGSVSGNFTISGTAEANSTVELFEGLDPRGTTQANASGQWSINLTDVSDGPHSYTAKATDAASNTSAESNPARTIMVDATLPTVTGKSPKPNTTGISPTANISVTFSEAMMRSSLTRTTLKVVRVGTTRAVGASLSYPAPNRVVLNPTDSLVRGATYRVTIVGGTSGAKDLVGNALAANVSWRFEVRA